MLDRALELVDRDRDGLDVADDVGELQLDEADAARPGGSIWRSRRGGLGAGRDGQQGLLGCPVGDEWSGYARPLSRPGVIGSGGNRYISLYR